MKRASQLTSVLALGAALVAGATLAAKADQLADIRSRGKLICGTLGTAEPFSFQHPQTRQIVGYDVDICQKVAESLGVALELKPIAVEARIPELTQGRVDILAANLGHTPERAQQIDFSFSYFVSQQKIMVTRESGLTLLEQLAGKKVTAIKGSSSEQGVRRLIPTADTVTFQDTSSAFLALVQDKVDAFCASELILVKLRQQAQATNPMVVIEKSLFAEPWGLGLRRGETAFRNHVNGVLAGLESSGEIDRIFTKWLGEGTVFNIRRDFKIEEIR
ncbi:ABC transporter substrate-binding protein [Phreatobacter stygius]|uniref:Transporter substrate-binding domain-containing protein n=1 Tax=Phreatobacter stygius TaxID=1940610 RepID=A0A4D7B2D1_9HYPH|nr:ABC transporter substrate-binding protein [Phreatobacter stygius]QCI66991.1 transporter substrate-binding domain-containing protein [Phreatobacter stygius]